MKSVSILLLFSLWLSVQFLTYHILGIRTGADTEVYVKAAHELLASNWPEGRLVWYTSYIVLLALVFGLGGSLGWVVIIQSLLSGMAVLAIWFAVKKIKAEFWVRFVAVLLYLGWFKIHQWNTFIYTESIFTSLCVITFAVLLHIRKPIHIVSFALLFILTFFCRPTGFCYLLAVVAYALSNIPWSQKVKVGIGISLIVGSLLLLNQMLGEFTLIESYAKAEIIYPNISLGVEAPDDLSLPASGLSPLYSLFLFAAYNPFYFSKICLLKLLLFLANVKPYFSWLHNTMIVLILYPLYLFAFFGIKHFPVAGNAKYFMLTFIVAQSFTVMLTTENWDGRFLIPLLPFVFMLSAIGLWWAFRILSQKRT